MQGNKKSSGPSTNDRPTRVRCGELCTVVAGLVLLCCPAPGYAAEWSFDPAATVLLGYESNAALTTDPHKGVSEGIIVPELGVRRLTETSAVNVGLLGRGTYYSGSEFPDTTEGQAALSSFARLTERTRVGFDAVARWDSLFESAVLGSGTGNVQDVDIGLVTTKVRREWREVSPSVSYALTERGSVALSYRLTDVRFGDVGTSGLVDYQQSYLSGTYSYSLTPTDDLNLVVVGAQFRPASGTDSDTAELLAGFVHRFSSTSSAGLRAGAGKTTETMADGSQVDTSLFVLEATGSQRMELSQLNAVVSRDVQPSGSGQSVSTDQLRLDWTRRLSQAMASVLRATVFRNKSLQGSDPTVDRRYAEAAAGVDWMLAPDWSVGLTYQYRYQKYDVASDSAGSNGIFFSVSWAPPRPH